MLVSKKSGEQADSTKNVACYLFANLGKIINFSFVFSAVFFYIDIYAQCHYLQPNFGKCLKQKH